MELLRIPREARVYKPWKEGPEERGGGRKGRVSKEETREREKESAAADREVSQMHWRLPGFHVLAVVWVILKKALRLPEHQCPPV